jgi:5-methyltetrahydropteroyltriglutamate--homocysteine methyltransferase
VKRSQDRILTTHTGSLPRPDTLLAMMTTKSDGEAFSRQVRSAVTDAVRKQAEAGVDVVSDGEMAKPSFFHYVSDRIRGFEGINREPPDFNFDADFPGYMAWRMRAHTSNPSVSLASRPECVGPLTWKGHAALQADIDNFKAALSAVAVEEAFLPCASVGIIAQRLSNAYYSTYEAYVQAIAEAMREEYSQIAKSGLLVQIDAPEMCIDRNLPEFRDKPMEDFRKRLGLWVDALNYALTNVPEEQVRFHVCWGNFEAPHTHDVPLREIVDIVLKVNAAAYSVEASNPRHAHEWKIWREVKLPDGKVLIPGVIDTLTNVVEHPEVVADRILTYAATVGRENVIAGTDCGFGTAVGLETVYPAIVWAKLRALADGAALASRELWGHATYHTPGMS